MKNDGATINAFSPKTQIGEQLDVVFAKEKGNKASHESSGLVLNFDHILSQIKIKAKHSSDTYTYQVKGIRIAYVGGSADYTFNPAKTHAARHSWTAPATKKGRLVFGFGCGLITFLIRKFGGYPEGVMFSILIMNAVAPFLNNLSARKYGYGKKGNRKPAPKKIIQDFDVSNAVPLEQKKNAEAEK